MESSHFSYGLPKTMLLGLGLDKVDSKPPKTLIFDKGSPIVKNIPTNSSEEAVKQLKAQNSSLNNQRLVELTYGPPRPHVDSFKPRFVQLDNKILVFQGVLKEEINDWCTEKDRFRFVNIFYYLQDDTLKIYEPSIPNSGLYQGLMFARSQYPHHECKRNYHWRDMNVGQDIQIYGRMIHIYDCDEWTKVFLTHQGIDVGEPEAKVEDPYMKQRENMQPMGENVDSESDDLYAGSKFFANDGRVLRFYGIFINDKEEPTAVRRVILKYYLGDDSLEIVENWPPNSGRGPAMSASRTVFDSSPVNPGGLCSWARIIKRQKVLMNRKKEVDKVPCYLEPSEDDNVKWLTWKILKTDAEIEILGKTFFFNKCDAFTSSYYKSQLGIDMPQSEILPKPKLSTPVLLPPATFGTWEETLEDCYRPHAVIRSTPTRIVAKSQEQVNTQLNFSAYMDTPSETEHNRHFIINFFCEDNTVRVFEERRDGFMGGVFLKRTRLRKDHLPPGWKPPEYYEVGDFYVGARIKVFGTTFVIKDADVHAFNFMEKHPEIYLDLCIKEQRRLANIMKGRKEITENERMSLLHELRNSVQSVIGSENYSLPKVLDIQNELLQADLFENKLYSANLPIPQSILRKVANAFTFNGKTDVKEVLSLLRVALGKIGEDQNEASFK